MDAALSRDEPQATEADEVLRSACAAGCGTVVERTIPAGTSAFAAGVLRGIPLMCPPCIDADEKREAELERERLRRAREDRCALPKLLRGLTWESYETHRRGAAGALAAAQAWAAGTHSKPGLMLVGGVGVGKTRLAATAAWARMDRGDVRYVNVAELIVKLSAAFGDKDRAEALRILTGRGALILDDLDKVNPSMTVLAHLYTAIDGRVQSGAPLIVTTNLTLDGLAAKLGSPRRGEDGEERRVTAEAITSRLDGHCTIHGIQGEDGRA